jgi:hypothetical protein
MEKGELVFLADVNTVGAHTESMGGFIAQADRKDWKLGDYISGCAVRLDAGHIFERVKQHVRNPSKIPTLNLKVRVATTQSWGLGDGS